MKAEAAPEFSRTYRLTQVRQQPLTVSIEADEAERLALARRFGLVSLDKLTASVTLTADGDDVLADGTLIAAVEQACVASGEPIAVTLDEPLALRFTPEPESSDADDEEDEMAESSADLEDRDLIHYEGGHVDIGEAVAQTLLLSLDPYPRSSDADSFLREKGVVREEDAGPFSALAALKDQLQKK